MIRRVKVADAQQILNLSKQLVTETDFMLHEVGEENLTLAEQEIILSDFVNSSNKAFWVLEVEAQIVGLCVGIGGRVRRNQHNLYCVMGILQAYTGQGLGRKLLETLEGWAHNSGHTRLELTVMFHNKAARGLYLSQGFEEEGVKRQSLKIEGDFVDEIYMSKLLV